MTQEKPFTLPNIPYSGYTAISLTAVDDDEMKWLLREAVEGLGRLMPAVAAERRKGNPDVREVLLKVGDEERRELTFEELVSEYRRVLSYGLGLTSDGSS